MSGSNIVPLNTPIEESMLFQRVSAVIEGRKRQAAAYANREVFWRPTWKRRSSPSGKRSFWNSGRASRLSSAKNEPIGLILCPAANRVQLELLEMDRAGIAGAEFWAHLPPKDEFTSKINAIMAEAKERLDRRRGLPMGPSAKTPRYFYEPKDDADD